MNKLNPDNIEEFFLSHLFFYQKHVISTNCVDYDLGSFYLWVFFFKEAILVTTVSFLLVLLNLSWNPNE